MLKLNRDNEGGVFVKDILNIDKYCIHASNVLLTEDKNDNLLRSATFK